MRIKPFQSLCPPAEAAAQVSSVPYDTVETGEARALAEGNPRSFLHVVRPEIDLPEGGDMYSDAVYDVAERNLRKFEKEGWLLREKAPGIYVYSQSLGGHIQYGVVACCHVEDYENGLIKRHEKTRRDKEEDRTRLTARLRAHTGPVFLTYRGNSEVDALVARVREADPLFALTAPDGVEHRGWRADSADEIVAAFRAIDAFYVADGHHRAAASARVGRECRESNPAHSGDEEYNWFMAVIFPAAQLRIRPIHRYVTDLNRLSAGQFMDAVSLCCRVEEAPAAEPAEPGRIGMYLNGKWHELVRQSGDTDDPVAALDVSFLQDRILNPLLGLTDPRIDPRIAFVAGSRGLSELIAHVDSGRAAAAFALHPVGVEQVMSIADANLIMPPKSTWFEPKLRSGLFVHTF